MEFVYQFCRVESKMTKLEQPLENSASFQAFTNGIKVGFRNSGYKICSGVIGRS